MLFLLLLPTLTRSASKRRPLSLSLSRARLARRRRRKRGREKQGRKKSRVNDFDREAFHFFISSIHFLTPLSSLARLGRATGGRSDTRSELALTTSLSSRAARVDLEARGTSSSIVAGGGHRIRPCRRSRPLLLLPLQPLQPRPLLPGSTLPRPIHPLSPRRHESFVPRAEPPAGRRARLLSAGRKMWGLADDVERLSSGDGGGNGGVPLPPLVDDVFENQRFYGFGW